MNRLFFGDNLGWLRDPKEFPDASVDLVYLDPPFNSNADYNVLFREACLRAWRVLSGGGKSVVCHAGSKCLILAGLGTQNFFKKLVASERIFDIFPPLLRLKGRMDSMIANR